jgi:transcriptional regulator with XRE-family HTH domain
MNAAARLRTVRVANGLSIRDLAELAGVAASTIWRIEAGRVNPTVTMLERLVDAAAVDSAPAATTREALVSLAIGRLSAAALLRDPSLVTRAERRVQAMLASETTPTSAGWYREWQRLLGGALEDVVAALIDPSERGYELRSHTPFVGILSDEDRLTAIRRASREHRAARPA